MNNRDSNIGYAIMIVGKYKDKIPALKGFLSFPSFHGTMNLSYHALVKEKYLPPLEEIPLEEKERFWNESKKYSPKKEERIQIARCLYIIEFIHQDQYAD